MTGERPSRPHRSGVSPDRQSAGQGARRDAGGTPAVHYGADLAFIHHAGFSEFAEAASIGVIETLWRHDIREGLVLDIGCGSGVLSRELTRAGFDVIGFDASPAMIELARANAPDARFEVARFAEADLPASDAVVSIGEVLNYAPFDEVRTFISNMSARLLLFDVAESAVDHESRIGGDDWTVIAIQEGNARRILTFREIDGEVRRSEEVHQLWLHDREAMLALLRENGFRVKVRRSYGSRRLPKGHAVYECVKRDRSSGGMSGHASLVLPKIR